MIEKYCPACDKNVLYDEIWGMACSDKHHLEGITIYQFDEPPPIEIYERVLPIIKKP